MIKKIAVKSEIEVDDPWVEKLATSATSDFDYKVMIQHLEVQTEHKLIPKDCGLCNYLNVWNVDQAAVQC